jgi:hypothetical protein
MRSKPEVLGRNPFFIRAVVASQFKSETGKKFGVVIPSSSGLWLLPLLQKNAYATRAWHGA